MSQENAQQAVMDAPAESAQEQSADRKPKLLPPYAVIVFNDELHTFPYVIETFRKVFGYQEQKCFQLAHSIHKQGRGVVWTGPKEVAELKRDLIRGAGPDLYATKKVDFPLGVAIEPLPG